MLIVLDMDDVLTQTNQHWVDCYNKDWDDDRTLEHIKGWNIHYWVRPECGKRIYDYLSKPGFYRNMQPVKGAVEGVKSLLAAGHDIVVATAAPVSSPTSVEEKKEWIREHMPFFKLSNLLICHRKELIKGDLLFDDGSHNLRDFLGVAVCMSRPWNRGEPHADVWVNGWSDFLEEINKMSDCGYMERLRKKSLYRIYDQSEHMYLDEEDEWRYERQ